MRKGRTFPPEILTRDEVDGLLAACGRSRTGLRNRALIVLLYRGGLRLAEALDVRPCDIDWATGDVRVLHGKGDKARTTTVGPEGAAMIELWAAKREAPANDPLICTLSGARLQPSYVAAMLHRLADRAGITKAVRPHGLRHTFAHELAAEGAAPHLIRDLLGHSSLAATDRYLRALGAGPALEFARAREWSAPSLDAEAPAR